METLADLPGVAEVRTAGLCAAVEFTAEALAETRGLVDVAAVSARNHGVITRGLRGVALQLSPAFVSTEDELAGDGRGPARGGARGRGVVRRP